MQIKKNFWGLYFIFHDGKIFSFKIYLNWFFTILFAAFDFSFSCPSAAICFGIQLWQQLQPRHSSLALQLQLLIQILLLLLLLMLLLLQDPLLLPSHSLGSH